MTNETETTKCDEVCEPTRKYKHGETIKFILDNYGSLYPYYEEEGFYFKEGYKMVECEITNICNIKLGLEYPVRNIYEEEENA